MVTLHGRFTQTGFTNASVPASSHVTPPQAQIVSAEICLAGDIPVATNNPAFSPSQPLYQLQTPEDSDFLFRAVPISLMVVLEFAEIRHPEGDFRRVYVQKRR